MLNITQLSSSRLKHLFLMVFSIILAMTWSKTFSQPIYMMHTSSVDDCEGTLLDSENGPEEGQYDHNENYTFTICVDGAEEIILDFSFFATEENYDVLTIYDGPDTGSPVIAELTGSISPAPVFIATSGCVTLQFISDDNIVAAGWIMDWSVEIDDPEPPELGVVSMLECPMSSIVFQFDLPVDCDMMSIDHFSILGPGGPSIAEIIPLDCFPGEQGQRFEVVFSAPLSQPGTYRLLFNGAIQDACGNWHDVSANVLFELSNCPFDVVIELVEEACEGDCGRVRAVIIGDAGVPYEYMWSHNPLNQPVVDVCTEDPMLVSVTVTDPVSMEIVIAQYNYMPLELPVILNPVNDTICSSQGDHFYTSSLPGGNYYSNIIPEWHHATGRYEFWRWTWTGNLNQDIVTYVAPNGCEAYDTLYVLPTNAGSLQASCLNGPDFMVNGGTPSGGVWSGPHITPDGMFSPAASGSFIVAYNAPNGCPDWKRINVADEITMPDIDTICSTQEIDLLGEPFGGSWSGPGIVNSVLGRIQAWLVTPNQTYTYIFNVNGCSDTMDIYIQELWAGPDVALCVEDTLLPLNETGTWSGPGTYVPGLNAFNISGLPPGEYTYTLSAFGCTDAFKLYMISPNVDVQDALEFCQDDEWFLLGDYVDYSPNWGSFSGPTIMENNDQWYFNPAMAGPGYHMIVFEAVGCTDTIGAMVEPFAEIPEYEFCELSMAQILSADPPGGVWTGPGFLDGESGLFDPQLLGPGIYEITYEAPSGCITIDTIEIILKEEVSINGVTQQYCFTDTMITVDIAPSGGSFYINGDPSSASFNPALLGTGTHELFYTRGTGPCASDERVFISILPPIAGETGPPDSICHGENAVVAIEASGGAGSLTSTWDQGLGFGVSHIVNPLNNTWYTVTVTDGCSEPYIDSAFLFVHQPFDIELITGPPVCYTDSSYVEIVLPLPGQYTVQWILDSIVEGPFLEGQPGIYSAEVSELFSGCVQEYDIRIPGPPPLSANFTIIPNQPCIDIIDNEVQIIDLATGYTGGTIDFGDGTGAQPYIPGELISHAYTNIGNYEITLMLHNELGCTDTLTRQLCVENRVEMFVPNVFSPNGDGNNDVFKIESFGLGEARWEIYNRYGEKVFTSSDLNDYWDGTFGGQILDPEVFVIHIRYTDQATGEPGVHVSSLTLVR